MSCLILLTNSIINLSQFKPGKPTLQRQEHICNYDPLHARFEPNVSDMWCVWYVSVAYTKHSPPQEASQLDALDELISVNCIPHFPPRLKLLSVNECKKEFVFKLFLREKKRELLNSSHRIGPLHSFLHSLLLVVPGICVLVSLLHLIPRLRRVIGRLL